MKKIYATLLAASIASAAYAQSAIDAQTVSQSDFRGTARFMSMGGAFTALGGDLSTLNQNPAGIGLYRKSEIGVTLDINHQNFKTASNYLQGLDPSQSQTVVSCNNFGYIGSTNLNGAMRTFNWGVTYNRAATFNRVYQGYIGQTSTSLSNYIASYTGPMLTNDRYTAEDMLFNNAQNYNPYLDSSIDWLSILAYNSYMINDLGGNQFAGLFQNGTQGDALYTVQEKGGIDEYDISFGGNVENVVYWGITVGITDLNYTRTAYYSESMADARICNVQNGGAPTANGSAGFDLYNRKYINGTGANIKLGVIVKPINELRIGLAVHTPTWYSFNQGFDGNTDYAYTNYALPDGPDNPLTNMVAGKDPETTDNGYRNWHFSSPWKMMVGVAGVIGNRAIVSLDYQYEGFNSMRMSTPAWQDDYGYVSDFQPNHMLNSDIKNYFQSTNTIRLGLEYRLTPQLSVRAGYNYATTNVKKAASNGSIVIGTAGTDASYTFDKDTYHITCGLGYKYKSWYIDAAYVYRHRESTYHAYTNFNGNIAPAADITNNSSSFVISTGIRF